MDKLESEHPKLPDLMHRVVVVLEMKCLSSLPKHAFILQCTQLLYADPNYFVNIRNYI